MQYDFEAIAEALRNLPEADCSTCMYAKESQYKAIYHCRRFPPQIDANNNSRFPMVTPKDSCGEYRMRSR